MDRGAGRMGSDYLERTLVSKTQLSYMTNTPPFVGETVVFSRSFSDGRGCDLKAGVQYKVISVKELDAADVTTHQDTARKALKLFQVFLARGDGHDCK